jgi:GNAT superfamily N-acetyltransferase
MPPLSLSGVAVPVREARDADRQAVRRVLLAAYSEFATVLPPAVFGPYLADILDLDARAAGSRLLVAEHARRVAGAVSFYPDAAEEGLGLPAGWAGLRALGVDPALRGRGIGRALVEACRQRALAAGAEVLSLHTGAFMRAAVALYEAMGFRRVPEYDFEAPWRPSDGARPVRVIAYRLDLT